MSTEEQEQQVIEILTRVNDLSADALNAFYDIAGKDLGRWDDIRVLVLSIKATKDILIDSHEEEQRYR